MTVLRKIFEFTAISARVSLVIFSMVIEVSAEFLNLPTDNKLQTIIKFCCIKLIKFSEIAASFLMVKHMFRITEKLTIRERSFLWTCSESSDEC